jgi:drug/metabolite transporter (DMT)-like permease
VTAVLLSLSASLAWGFASFLSPVLARKHSLGPVLLVQHVVSAGGAALLLLLTVDTCPPGLQVLAGLAAGVCTAVAAAAAFAAATTGPVSVVTPINSTGAALPVVLGLALGERPSLVQLVGIPLALIGTVLVAARRSGGTHQLTGRVVGLAAFSAVAYGGHLIFLAAAAQESTSWGLFITRFTALVITAPFVLPIRGRPRVQGRAVPALAVPGALMLMGTACFSIASVHGLVSVVSVLSTLFPVVTVSLAVAVLGERLLARQLAGFLSVLLGIVLIGAG